MNGIFHWSDNQCLTKYEIAIYMAQVFGLSFSHLTRADQPADDTPRPKNCYLDCSDLIGLGIIHRRPFYEAIKTTLERFSK